MKRIALQVALLALLAVAVTPRRASAQIAVGLDWRKGIFAQEYFKDGVPRCLISNNTDGPLSVAVFGDPPRVVVKAGPAKPLVGPFDIAAHSTIDADITPLLGHRDMLHWRLGDGTDLGLMFAIQAPPTKVIIYAGLNLSGGSHFDMYTEQDSTSWLPGQQVIISLMVPANMGVVHFPRSIEATKNANPIIQLPFNEVTCQQFHVTTTDKEFTVDTGAFQQRMPVPGVQPALYEITLHLAAPATPGAYYFNAWVDMGQRGGYGICRSIIVAPKDAPPVALPSDGVAPTAAPGVTGAADGVPGADGRVPAGTATGPAQPPGDGTLRIMKTPVIVY